eukprot:gene23253-26321_t
MSTKRKFQETSSEKTNNSDHISVKKADLPRYLGESEFYEALDEEDDEILVPTNCLKWNTAIQDSSDLSHMLSTIRYWGLKRLPAELIDFIIGDKIGQSDLAINEYAEELKFLKCLETMRDSPPEKHVDIALHRGEVDIIRHLVEDKGSALPYNACVVACTTGNAAMLEYVHQHGCFLDPRDCGQRAIVKGHLACVKYIHEKGNGIPPELAKLAATAGRLEIMKYLNDTGIPWDESTCAGAAQASNVVVL